MEYGKEILSSLTHIYTMKIGKCSPDHLNFYYIENVLVVVWYSRMIFHRGQNLWSIVAMVWKFFCIKSEIFVVVICFGGTRWMLMVRIKAFFIIWIVLSSMMVSFNYRYCKTLIIGMTLTLFSWGQHPWYIKKTFNFTICYFFLHNPYIRIYWQQLYFQVSVFLGIYRKIKFFAK